MSDRLTNFPPDDWDQSIDYDAVWEIAQTPDTAVDVIEPLDGFEVRDVCRELLTMQSGRLALCNAIRATWARDTVTPDVRAVSRPTFKLFVQTMNDLGLWVGNIPEDLRDE
jgi:hypothetical protein